MAITLGLVEAVDDNGVYVSMPGSRGVLRGPYETVQNVTAGDKVLMVTTDDGDNVIVGLAGASVPKNIADPGTVTDNAVVRWDGTSGSAVQNSAVTIDDSGNVAGVSGLTVAKSAYAGVQVSSNAGTGPYIQLATAGVGRWDFFRNDDAESGSNAGSDLQINRLSDAGGLLGAALKITRASGKVTIGAAGTTAGIELGSSGPTITTGTGAPSHSAPNGSIYLRTDGTASTTLYVRAGGAWTALS